MAKDMTGVYADMLTKELVKLRAKHMAARNQAREYSTRLAKKDVERLTDLIEQINNELATRVASMNIFA